MALVATCLAFGYAIETGEIQPSAGKVEAKVVVLESGEKFRGFSSGSSSNWEYDNSSLSGGTIVRKSDAVIKHTSLPIDKEIGTVTGKYLASIKNAFSLSNEELSQVLLSGRKTVHNWMNEGALPNKSKAKRILEINDIAQAWMMNGYDYFPEIVRAQTLDGRRGWAG